MATLIGIVGQVVGEVFVVPADGSRRQLVEGDRVFAGEQLLTGDGGAVAIRLVGGGELTVGRDSSLLLDNVWVQLAALLARDARSATGGERLPQTGHVFSAFPHLEAGTREVPADGLVAPAETL